MKTKLLDYLYLHKSLRRKCVFPQNSAPFVDLAAATWPSQTRLVVQSRPSPHSGIAKERAGRHPAPQMFGFQMKPQEKAFFTDPMKLIQSRMEQISKVCSPPRGHCPGTLQIRVSWWIFSRGKCDDLFVPQISCFQRTQMERVIGHLKAKSGELQRHLRDVTEKAYRWDPLQMYVTNDFHARIIGPQCYFWNPCFLPGKCLSSKERMPIWKSSCRSWNDRPLNWKNRFRRGGYVFKRHSLFQIRSHSV